MLYINEFIAVCTGSRQVLFQCIELQPVEPLAKLFQFVTPAGFKPESRFYQAEKPLFVSEFRYTGLYNLGI
jgi:hypothetical protein